MAELPESIRSLLSAPVAVGFALMLLIGVLQWFRYKRLKTKHQMLQDRARELYFERADERLRMAEEQGRDETTDPDQLARDLDDLIH